MPARKRLDPAAIAGLRAQGLSWQRVAERLDCSDTHLLAARKRHGLPVNPRVHAPARRPLAASLTYRQRASQAEFGEPLADVIIGLRDLGYSWATVAGAMDISCWTLYDWRKQLGLPTDRRDRRSDPDPTAEPLRHAYDWLRGTSGRCDLTPLSGEEL